MKTRQVFYSWFSIRRFFCSILLLISVSAVAQDILLQGWWYNYPANIGIQRWGENFRNYIPDFAEAGFTYLWLPPLSRPNSYPSDGYDIKDYYDLGGNTYGPFGATSFGTREDVDNVIAMLKQYHIHPLADMVYNQRTGGNWENNPYVKKYMTQTLTPGDVVNSSSDANDDNPYPSDRWRAIIPIGGNTGLDTGWYYFKVRSATQTAYFFCDPYTFKVGSNKMPFATTDSSGDSWEYEPNNGGECGDSDNFYNFTYNKFATIDGPACYYEGSGCGIDEFRIHLDTSMYNVTGDTLYVSMTNDQTAGVSGFSDHYLYDLWHDSSIVSQVTYQTRTDFTHMPSGRGYMDKINFKPDTNATNLNGNWDVMLFFYDIDQFVPSTISCLGAYQEWMFDSIGIEAMRLDAVKNYCDQFAAEMIDSAFFHGHNPGIIVGEYYDGYAPDLTGYLATVRSEMAPEDTLNMQLFDFALRFPLQDANEYPPTIDVRNVFGSGIVNGGGGKANQSVTWVNNHDFTAPGMAVNINPELSYAYIISNKFIGTPDVYLGDYFSTNFLKGRIKGIMHASQKYTFGADTVEYLNNFNTPYNTTVNSGYVSNDLIYQFRNPVTRRAAIMAINFSEVTMDVYQQIDTSYVATGDTFTDIFGVGANPITLITDTGQIHIVIPPRSFTMFVQGMVDSLVSFGDTLPIAGTSAVQTLEQNTNPILNVFPNPFTGKVNIAVSDLKANNIMATIYDISGRQLFAQILGNPTNGIVSFDPGIQTSGVYLLKITANNNSYFYKLIKN